MDNRKNKLKGLCLLLESYYPVVGGTETQSKLLVEDMARKGIKITIITRRSNKAYRKIECKGNIQIYRVSPVGKGHLKKWFLLFTCAPLLLKLRDKYDIILVPGFRVLGIGAVVVSKIASKICILRAVSNGEMSGSFFDSGLKKLHLKPYGIFFKTFIFLRNRILRKTSAFIAISSEIASEMKNSGVNKKIIRFIPNGVDTKKFFPVSKCQKSWIRKKLNIPQKDLVVIYTGRLVSYKGLPILLKVWKKINEKHKNVRLLLVGSGGFDIHNCEKELKRFVKHYNLNDSIFFTGDVKNVNEYLQGSDIFVLPTENEAFGISLIEAMACGLPVISTNVGGLKDIITPQKDGLVVEAGNFEQLYNAINILITNPSLSISLGGEALQTVRKRYSKEAVAEKYIDLFQKMQEMHNKH